MKSKYNLINKTILIIAFVQLIALFGFCVKTYGETINNVIDFAAGSGFSVIIDEKGDIWSWGSNEYGQLGLGDTAIRNEPTRILVSDDGNILPKFSKITAGYGLTLCLDIHGDLWSFGNSESGQLGMGDVSANMLRPFKITLAEDGSDLPKFTKVKADYLTSFAIDLNGNLWAWGNGYPGSKKTYAPKMVHGLFDVIDVVADYGTYYALDNCGKVYFWGENMDNSVSNVPIPIKINFENDIPCVKQISCGDKSLLILDENGRVKEIKNNEEIEFAFGIDKDSIVEMPMFKFISKRKGYSLAIDDKGSLWAWGHEKDYENIKYPTKINDFHEDVKFISLSTSIDILDTKANNFTLALDENSRIWSWGNNENNVTATGIQYANIDRPTLSVFSNPYIEVVEMFNEPEIEVSRLEEENNDILQMDSITLIAEENTLDKTEDIELKAPFVNSISESDKVISGTGRPDNIVSVNFKDSNNMRIVTKVEKDGAWEMPIPNGVGMSGEIFAIEEDDNGNVSPETKIFVKNNKTYIIGDIAINAYDFRASIADVELFTDEDIIKNSGVKAWNVMTGVNLIDKIKIDKSAIKKEPGTYPIVISVDMLKVQLEEDDLNKDAVIVHMTVGDTSLPFTGEMIFKRICID